MNSSAKYWRPAFFDLHHLFTPRRYWIAGRTLLKFITLDRQRLVNRIPQHHIATFLGITPASLSRIRKPDCQKQEKIVSCSPSIMPHHRCCLKAAQGKKCHLYGYCWPCSFIELAWVVLNWLGIERVTTEPEVRYVGDIHLVYMPYSHSVLSSAILVAIAGIVVWLWEEIGAANGDNHAGLRFAYPAGYRYGIPKDLPLGFYL